MRSFTTLILCCICQLTLFAQKECSSAGYMQRLLRENPSLARRLKEVSIAQTPYGLSQHQSQQESPVYESPILIPVVVHVIYGDDKQNISVDQINSQIDALNLNFNKENPDISSVPAAFLPFAASTHIRFALAKVDPEGRATNGITRKKSTRQFWIDDDKIKDPNSGGVQAWDTRHYLNIWICNLQNGLLGYSSFPGSPEDRDGVVMRPNVFGTRGTAGAGAFNLGRTAVHEIGHWLNLIHLWGDTPCGTDNVDDTPPQQSYNRGCPSFPRKNKDCSDANPNGEMFMNFMDFSDDACMNMFTMGQNQRMHELFLPGGLRNSFLSSTAQGEPYNFTPSSESAQLGESLRVYPNPADDILMLLPGSADQLTGFHYSIFSADGRIAMTGLLSKGQNSLSVKMLRSGLYFLRVGNGNAGKTVKFLKK